MADNPFEFPISGAESSSVYMNETFRAHLAAGFTEDQALKLIAYTTAAIAASIMNNTPGTP